MPTESRTERFDVHVAGDGPVGCALALALQGSGLSIALSGDMAAGTAAAQQRAGAAVRPIALSYASRLILERLGTWSGLRSTPIEDIHVSEAGAFGQTRISRQDLAVPALGYVSAYDDIAPAIAAALDRSRTVCLPRGARPTATLTVHAEGVPAGDAVYKDYAQEAVVALVHADTPARGVAYERFTRQGPLALLPHARGYGLVWSHRRGTADTLLQAADAEFLAQLQSAFGNRAGRFVAVAERAAFPMALRYSACRARAGEISIGNAAQTLHPVAGQGLNLGLRDAWELAQRLRAATGREAIGSAAFADEYARARRLDARATIRMTDLLASLYVRDDPLSALLRRGAMTVFDLLPPARRLLARRMVYGASAWP
jgi:2-octaprenyl-6-methoxyphenol hydroxylase